MTCLKNKDTEGLLVQEIDRLIAQERKAKICEKRGEFL